MTRDSALVKPELTIEVLERRMAKSLGPVVSKMVLKEILGDGYRSMRLTKKDMERLRSGLLEIFGFAGETVYQLCTSPYYDD